MQWYFREIGYENIIAENVKNKDIMNLEFEGFMVAHETCSFV